MTQSTYHSTSSSFLLIILSSHNPFFDSTLPAFTVPYPYHTQSDKRMVEHTRSLVPRVLSGFRVCIFVALLLSANGFTLLTNQKPDRRVHVFSSATADAGVVALDPTKEAVKLFGRLAEKYIMLDASGGMCCYSGCSGELVTSCFITYLWLPCSSSC